MNQPVEKPKKRKWLRYMLISLLLLATLMIAIGQYYYTRADSLLEQEIVALLEEQDIEAELSVSHGGLNHWEIHDMQLRKEDLAFSIGHVDIALSRKEGHIAADVKLSDIRHIPEEGQKPYIVPMAGEASITIPYSASTPITLQSTLYDTPHHWEVKLDALYSRAKEEGWGHFTLPPVIFETGILQPDQLSPSLRGLLQQTQGQVELVAHMEWGEQEQPENYATLSLSDLSTQVKGVAFKNMDGSIQFDSLSPLATKGQQTLTIEEILLGLPLKDGKLAFTLTDNTQLALAGTSWQWAGGTLRTEPVKVDLTDAQKIESLKVGAKNLLLESLLANLLEKGITATGKLSGSIPVTLQKGQPMIKGGVLTTEGGGIIRYQPTADSPLQKGGSTQTDLLLDAMEDFHYDVVRMNVNSLDEKNIEVKLHVKGYNPKVYDGKAIELNVNLTGNLLDVVKSGMDVYSLPERLEKQLTQ